MNADIKGALSNINKSYRFFEHNGKRMTKAQVKAVLQFGIKKGYNNTGQITDKEVDELISGMCK